MDISHASLKLKAERLGILTVQTWNVYFDNVSMERENPVHYALGNSKRLPVFHHMGSKKS